MKHLMLRVHGDSTHCEHCGKSWDTNDPSPPPCVAPAAKSRGPKIEIVHNDYSGTGHYTIYDTNSDWVFATLAPSRRSVETQARKHYREDKGTNYGKLEIVAGPKEKEPKQ